MTVSDLKRLKSLEAENRRLKQIVADQALDNLVRAIIFGGDAINGNGVWQTQK